MLFTRNAFLNLIHIKCVRKTCANIIYMDFHIELGAFKRPAHDPQIVNLVFRDFNCSSLEYNISVITYTLYETLYGTRIYKTYARKKFQSKLFANK